ncbi:MAG TPA: DUF2336 domain-containing protein [Hyphomicrobiales bacterium]|nr:DUF2336 domain-containing protein [Hyphomicrobiales bacterium]
MIGLVGEAGQVVRQEIAERLACHQNPPRRLVRALAAEDIAVAKPLLRHTPALSDEELAEIVLTTSLDHARAAAARPAFGAALSDAIIALEDPEAILTLLRNPYAALSAAGIQRLCRLARSEKAIAEALLARNNLQPPVLASLFWQATSEGREVILEERSAQAVWADEQPRLNAPLRRVDAADLKLAQEGFSKILLAGRVDDFRDLFGRAMGITPALADRIMKDESGEPFAIACRAAGFPMSTYTTLLILYNPAVGQSVQRVFALGSIYERIPQALAWRLLEAWSVQMRDDAPPADSREQSSAALRGAVHDPVGMRTERSSATYSASRAGQRPRLPAARPAQRSSA